MPIAKRECQFGAAAGKKGIGKSTQTLKIAAQYVRGNPSIGVKGRRVIIFDVNMEYPEIKRLAMKEVLRFSVNRFVEVRRIIPFFDDGRKMTTDDMGNALSEIMANFYGGLLIIEDISRYVGDNFKKDIIGDLATQRHRNCDVITHFQFIGKIGNPKMLGNLSFIRLHKTQDNVEMHRDKFKGGYYILLRLAEKIVEMKYKDGDIRFFVYVRLDDGKISGRFTKYDFMEILTDFIQENENLTIKPFLKRKTRDGKPMYNYAQALEECEKTFLEEYYGNK